MVAAGPASARYLVAAAVAVLAAALAVVGISQASDPFTVFAIVALPILTAVCFVEAGIRRAMDARWFWLLLAAAMLLVAAAGGLVAGGVERTSAPRVEVQLLRLGTMALALSAVFTSPFAGVSRLGRGRLALDALITALALFTVLWSAGLRPATAAGGLGGSTLVSILYPITDAIIATLVLQGLLGAAGHRLPLLLWSAGLLLILAANTGAAVTASALGVLPSWIYAAWALGFVCLAAGATSAEERPLMEETPSWRLQVLPYAAAAVAAVVAYLRLAATARMDNLVLFSSVLALSLLVLGRQWALASENRRLLVTVRRQPGGSAAAAVARPRPSAEAGAQSAGHGIKAGDIVRHPVEPGVWMVQAITGDEARALPLAKDGVPRPERVFSVSELELATVNDLGETPPA